MDKQTSLFTVGFSKAFELAFSTALYLDETGGQAFKALEGKVVELWIAPVKFPLFCLINHGKITTQTTLNGQADVTLKTGMRQLRVLTQEGYFETKYIRGDKVLGERFVQAMERLEVDWEEQLSHYTGDLIAFKVGHGVRTLLKTKTSAKQKMDDTFKEYLQFELQATPTKSQVNHFSLQVTETATALEALETRIERLLKG